MLATHVGFITRPGCRIQLVPCVKGNDCWIATLDLKTGEAFKEENHFDLNNGLCLGREGFNHGVRLDISNLVEIATKENNEKQELLGWQKAVDAAHDTVVKWWPSVPESVLRKIDELRNAFGERNEVARAGRNPAGQ